jgi:hypothetical protein
VAVADKVTIEVKDVDGTVVCTKATDAKDDDGKLAVHAGMNDVELLWKTKDAKVLDGMILWSGRGGAPRVPPGDYAITVTMGEQVRSVTGRILPDPRSPATTSELQARFRLVRDGNALVTEAHEAIATIRALRTQMQDVAARGEGEAKTKLEAAAKAADAALTPIEEALYQTRSKSSQDPLNFPIKLTDKLLGVLGAVNAAEFGPTAAQATVAAELSASIRAELATFATQKTVQLATFNSLARDLSIPHVK